MSLLGYSLGVQLHVFRPYLSHSEDFVAYYPEEEANCGVPLCAEDDGHYNALWFAQ